MGVGGGGGGAEWGGGSPFGLVASVCARTSVPCIVLTAVAGHGAVADPGFGGGHGWVSHGRRQVVFWQIKYFEKKISNNIFQIIFQIKFIR